MPYHTRRIVASPEFSPDGGTHDTNQRRVGGAISSSSSDSRIRYKTDGTNPTVSSGTPGYAQIFTAGSVAASYNINAIAYKPGWSDSDVSVSAAYTTKAIVSTPSFSPDGDTHDADQRSVSFSVSSSTGGAAVRYVVHSLQGKSSRSSVSATLNGNNYIELSSLTSMSTQAFSMGAWFKTSTTASDSTDWMGGSATQLRVQLNSAGKPQLQSSQCSNGCSSGDGSTAVRDGNWHHLLVTYGTGFVTLYVDGQQEQTAAALSATTFTAVRFGGSWASGNRCILALAGKKIPADQLPTDCQLTAG